MFKDGKHLKSQGEKINKYRYCIYKCYEWKILLRKTCVNITLFILILLKDGCINLFLQYNL